MTDNEKRAHDLALLVLQKAIDSSRPEIDFYGEYRKAFVNLLTELNHDFPRHSGE